MKRWWMETLLELRRSSGKGRKEIGPDLKWDGHTPGDPANRKSDVSPNPRVLRLICKGRGQNTLSDTGFGISVMCWLNKGNLYGFWQICPLFYCLGQSAVLVILLNEYKAERWRDCGLHLLVGWSDILTSLQGSSVFFPPWRKCEAWNSYV